MNAVFVDTGGWMACADRNDLAPLACMAARDATLEDEHEQLFRAERDDWIDAG
jgi:hypothetical protein